MNEKIFTMKLASENDADKIYSHMQEVYNQLENKALFVCDNHDFIVDHISIHGFVVMAYCNNEKFAGCLIVRFPGYDNDNLGKDTGLSDAQQLRVAHMESVVVLDKYRGNNLQYEMMKYAEKNIDTNKYRYILATVSPDNIYSRTNLIKCGYRFVLNKVKYGELSRDIYMKIL